jgi:hypothetical protein
MTAGIDELGNTLAFFYSDRDLLQSVSELFSGTIGGIAPDALNEPSL